MLMNKQIYSSLAVLTLMTVSTLFSSLALANPSWSCQAICSGVEGQNGGKIRLDVTAVGETAADAWENLHKKCSEHATWWHNLVRAKDDEATMVNSCIKN